MTALTAVLAFFAGSWPLWVVPLTVAAYLLARRPAPDAPNYDAEAYPDGLPSLRAVAEHVATVNLPPGDYLAAIYTDGSVEMVSVDDLARLPEVSER